MQSYSQFTFIMSFISKTDYSNELILNIETLTIKTLYMNHLNIDILPFLVFALFMVISLFTSDKNSQKHRADQNI